MWSSRWWLENQETTVRPGTKGRAFRGATLLRRCRTAVPDGPAAFPRCRSALPCIAGALRRSLLTSAAFAAPCSVRRLPGPFPRRRRSGSHQPPDLWIDSDGYSSRSSPVSSSMSAESSHGSAEASSEVGVGDHRTGRSCVARLVSTAAHHGQGRVSRKGRIYLRQPAQPEDRPTAARDHTNVAARLAQPGWRVCWGVRSPAVCLAIHEGRL